MLEQIAALGGIDPGAGIVHEGVAGLGRAADGDHGAVTADQLGAAAHHGLLHLDDLAPAQSGHLAKGGDALHPVLIELHPLYKGVEQHEIARQISHHAEERDIPVGGSIGAGQGRILNLHNCKPEAQYDNHGTHDGSHPVLPDTDIAQSLRALFDAEKDRAGQQKHCQGNACVENFIHRE